MVKPTFTSVIEVERIQSMATDAGVCAAARVSTKATESLHDWSEEASTGLIGYLMKNRHGSVFEHNTFTFFVKAPIFVFREFHRHRIGWSYNEESARYKQLDPVFYIPQPDREFKQVPGGKPGHYRYEAGSPKEHEDLAWHIVQSCTQAYEHYENMLAAGVAKEVARMVLPVTIYSSMYATCNARSLMSFLSLRKKLSAEEAQFPSNPMKEINVVADAMEEVFAAEMPVTHAAFVANGFVAP
jgi:thymidylate synthase (FAD)